MFSASRKTKARHRRPNLRHGVCHLFLWLSSDRHSLGTIIMSSPHLLLHHRASGELPKPVEGFLRGNDVSIVASSVKTLCSGIAGFCSRFRRVSLPQKRENQFDCLSGENSGFFVRTYARDSCNKISKTMVAAFVNHSKVLKSLRTASRMTLDVKSEQLILTSFETER